MKGLELARGYYETYGKKMLEEQFPSVLDKLAIGLAGSGSECYGFDDDISCDHDFEPGFCIFLPEEDVVDRRTAFLLKRAYDKLPKSFGGFERSNINPVGGNRHGVIRMDEFFLSKVGAENGELSVEEWLSIPEFGLLEVTNGEVFEDRYGRFTDVRKRLSCFPENVRIKKLAGHLLLMGQSGQYNYGRCIARNDTAAAQLAVIEFTQSALHGIYLLNRAYMPYYKWCFRGLKGLPILSGLANDLEYLISSGNAPDETAKKAEIIDKICSNISKELGVQGLLKFETCEMERLAYSLNDTITDSNIRNLNILYGV